MHRPRKEGVPPNAWSVINKLAASDREQCVEADAYRKIVMKINATRDPFARRVYSQVLEFALHEGTMRFSYVADYVLDEALREQKQARKELQPFVLFEGIEAIISQATFTENFGQSRRWPLNTRSSYSKKKRITGRGARKLVDEVLPADFRGAHYCFGIHSFAVGRVTEEIIRMIEKRYGLNFKEMERAREAEALRH